MSIDLLKRIVESYDEGGYRWTERLSEQIEEARMLISASTQEDREGETMTEKVFIVICRDRHSSDDITVHRSIESANRRVSEFRAYYDSDYITRDQWREEEKPRFGACPWVSLLTTYDDGPSVEIQEKAVNDE